MRYNPNPEVRPATSAGAMDDGLRGRSDGGPVRLRRNGRQRRAVGLYFSVKSGRHLPFESTLELHDLWRAEVDTAVVRSFPQPFTLQMVTDSVAWRYTPDRRDVLADGSERIVEVKDDGWAEQDPLLASRLSHVAEHLAERGLTFGLHTRSEIQAEPWFSAIQTTQRHRRTAVGPAEAEAACQQVGQGACTLGDLQQRLGGGPRALAVLCALVARRVIQLDLGCGLHEDAAVSLVR